MSSSRRWGLDVYEQEGDLFYEDLSSSVVTDDVFQRLLTFPNVVVTAHQAFAGILSTADAARLSVEYLQSWKKQRED